MWRETGAGEGVSAGTGATYNPLLGDKTVGGYKVYASVLTAEGAAANAQMKSANPPGFWAQETQKMLKEHPEYLEKTFVTETKDNGDYGFQGDSNTQWEHSYMWVEDKNGNPMPGYSSYTRPVFGSPAPGTRTVPHTLPSAQVIGRYINVNHALIGDVVPLKLDITNFNQSTKPAKRGETAELKLTGTLSETGYTVVWTKNNNSKALKTCEVTTTVDAASCTFDIPGDAKDGDIFTATLRTKDEQANPVASDSLIVHEGEAQKYEPRYEDVAAGTTSAAPLFDDSTTDDVENGPVPTGAKFELGPNAPAGAQVDPTTGVVTIPQLEDHEVTVPVTVVYIDGSRDATSVTFTETTNAPAPRIDTGDRDQVPHSGAPTELDDSVVNPAGVTGKVVRGENGDPVDGATVTVGEMGNVYMTIPPTAAVGDDYKVVYEKDGNTIGESPIEVTHPTPSVNVHEKDQIPNDGAFQRLDDIIANGTDQTTGTLVDGEGNPVEGAEVRIDVNGNACVKVPAAATPGDGYKIVYKNGDETLAESPITVVPNESQRYDVDYTAEYQDGITVEKGLPDRKLTSAPSFRDTTTNSIVGENDRPAASFELGDGAPSWVTVARDGRLGLQPGDDVEARDYEVPVKVTYGDGSSETVSVQVKVTESTAPRVEVGQPDEVANSGELVKVDDKVVNPDGVTGKVVDQGGDEVPGSTVTVDPSDGSVMVSVPEGTEPGDYKVVFAKDGKTVGESPITVVPAPDPQDPPTL